MGRAVKGALLGGTLFLALIVAPIAANAQESISIAGELQNGTTGAEIPPKLTVTLNVFNLGDNLSSRESAADAQGRFSFEGVPAGDGFGYIISTDYAGAVYVYESDYPLPSEPVVLTIYESTTSGEALIVNSHSLVVNAADPDTGLMNVLELVGLENTGDRTFVPDITQPARMDLLRFSLPSTVTNLDVQTSMRGGQILQVDLGFAITTPVPPGAYEIAYTFRAEYSDGKLTFNHAFPFGAATFRVLLLNNLGQATGDGLEEMDRLILGERDYQLLEANDLGVGARIELDFTGLPEPSLWQQWQNTVSRESFLTAVIPGAFGMALLALLAYVLVRKRSSSRVAIEETAGLGQPASLIEAIACLDNQFQQRELGKQEYLQRRSELKGQILGQPIPPSPPEARSASEGEADQGANETERPGL